MCLVNGHRTRTDDRFSGFDIQATTPISDKERKIEQILHRLSKVVRIDDELEQVDWPGGIQNAFNLTRVRVVRTEPRAQKNHWHTFATFFVVSFSER